MAPRGHNPAAFWAAALAAAAAAASLPGAAAAGKTGLAEESAPLFAAEAASKVWNINMYRAMEKDKGKNPGNFLDNHNLADIVGVMRYIMQEVVPEHSNADPDRESRQNGINAIARYKMQVRNPEGLGNSGLPGFGRHGAFDFGCVIEQHVLSDVVDVGDYVGASRLFSSEIKYHHEWYWFSVTGECPNLPRRCIKPFPKCDTENPAIIPAPCLNGGCNGKKWGRKCKAEPNFTDYANKDLLRECCLHYKSEDHALIAGGQCQPDETTGIVPEPTGEHGCVYKFEPLDEAQDYAMLDEIVGIKGMFCTDSQGKRRLCKDWMDWRDNCDDPDGVYKKKFQCDGECKQDDSPEIVTTTQCIEYDIHPFCHDSAPLLCDDPRCQALKPEERELGLPFWKGKCDVRSNVMRAQTFMNFFLGEAVMNTHTLVDTALVQSNPACGKEPMCLPNTNGGPYCTRTFSGLCSRCYIPGTTLPYDEEEMKSTAACPLNLFKEQGVKPKAGTQCRTKEAKDLCCLYNLPRNGCDSKDLPVEELPLDEDGYMLAYARQDTTAMESFLKRLVAEHEGVVADQAAFTDLAYWSWGAQPPVAPSATPPVEQVKSAFEALKARLLEVAPGPSPPTTTTTQETTSTTTTPEHPPPKPQGQLAQNIGVAVLLIAGAAGLALLGLQVMGQRPRQSVREANVEAELSRM